MRDKLKEENPDASMVDLSKITGLEFKKLSSDERKLWDDKAIEDKKRYDKEMKNYQPPSDEEPNDDEVKGGKKKKDPNAPKKNLSAFNFFSKAMRSEIQKKNPDATFGEMMKPTGAECNNISKEEHKK